VLVISQDHYNFAYAEPGFLRADRGRGRDPLRDAPFRTFIDAGDPDDAARAHAVQDGIAITGGGDGPFEAPDWNLDQLAMARKALNDVSTLGFDASRAYGTKEEVDPVDHLIGAISAWGGLPAKSAVYIVDAVGENDAKTSYAVTAKDVPVDAFWSVTVYNEDGYMEPNDLGRNSYNDVTAAPNEDGSITVHMGGCDDGRLNCIPITPGWSYAVRLYQPGPEILDGSWTFPSVEPVN
jgi:hypothetical protein